METVFLDIIAGHRLLTSVFALPVAYVAYLVVSRLYFHPLSRVPGPFLAALTDYYVTYYDIVKDGRMVHQLEKLHTRYGPVVRIGPNKLHFSDPKAFDLIYRDVRFPKEDWFYDAFNVPLSLFAICDIPKAKEAASVLRPLFSRKNILQVEGVVQDVISHFLQVLSERSKSSPRTNLHRGFASITMEVITTYSFAKSYGVVAYPSFSHPGLVGFQNSNFIIFVMRHFPPLRSIFFAMPLWLAGWFVPGIYGRRQFIQELDSQIAGILEDPTSLEREEHEIVYHHLLNPKVGKKPGRRELLEQAISLVAAGTETTANACIVAAFNVLRNPEIEARLRKELVEAWPEVETQMPLERLEKLPYLTSVIKEALRLSHGVVSPLPRVVSEPTIISGILVPQGTIASMGQSFMHYNPDIFPDPKEFRPDRWLAKGSSDLENCLVPFNKGPRMCTGMNLAWAELYLIIGNMFRKVDMELAGTVRSMDSLVDLAGRSQHTLVVVFLSLGVVALTSLAVYRLYFHPLASIPGPVIAAVTDLYATYHDLVMDGNMVKQLESLHYRYGPVVRFGPNKIHFSDPKAFDLIYKHPRFPKDAWFYDAFGAPLSLFACADISVAKERASLIRPLFSRKKVRQLEGVIQEVVDRFIVALSKKSGAPDSVNIYRGFASITMEVITTYCFAKTYGIVEHPDFAHPKLVGFQGSNDAMFPMQHFPFIRWLFPKIPLWILKFLVPALFGPRQFIQALDTQIAEILEDPTSLDRADHDIVYHHLLHPKAGEKPTRAGLLSNAISLTAAGTETVANACSVVTFRVLNNKAVKKRLVKELLDAWPDQSAPMPLERLEKLPYLTAVIKEGLRLSHGVVTPLPRVVTEPTIISGVFLPPKTIVSSGQTFTHHNSELFPNPTEFQPERWLAEDVSELDNHLVAFSKGQRMCIGINLAWAELYLILGNMFRKADMELSGTKESDFEFRALMTPRFRSPLQVKIVGVRDAVNAQ